MGDVLQGGEQVTTMLGLSLSFVVVIGHCHWRGLLLIVILILIVRHGVTDVVQEIDGWVWSEGHRHVCQRGASV
jgi:hypothetical protein